MEKPRRCYRCGKYLDTKPYYLTYGTTRFVVCSKCHYEVNKPTYREREQRKKEKVRAQVFSHYSGGTMKCKNCGFGDVRALSIDHIKGGGRKELLDWKTQGGVPFYIRLRQRGFPDGYQVLCRNCQEIKKMQNLENRPRGKEYSPFNRPID